VTLSSDGGDDLPSTRVKAEDLSSRRTVPDLTTTDNKQNSRFVLTSLPSLESARPTRNVLNSCCKGVSGEVHHRCPPSYSMEKTGDLLLFHQRDLVTKSKFDNLTDASTRFPTVLCSTLMLAGKGAVCGSEMLKVFRCHACQRLQGRHLPRSTHLCPFRHAWKDSPFLRGPCWHCRYLHHHHW
jgi:hypothetical protein